MPQTGLIHINLFNYLRPFCVDNNQVLIGIRA